MFTQRILRKGKKEVILRGFSPNTDCLKMGHSQIGLSTNSMLGSLPKALKLSSLNSSLDKSLPLRAQKPKQDTLSHALPSPCSHKKP